MTRSFRMLCWLLVLSACGQGAVETPLPRQPGSALKVPRAKLQSCKAWSPDATLIRIGDLQGQSHVSPLQGEMVEGVEGIVTRREARGFFLQAAVTDEDDCTSDAVFVYTASAPDAAVGDRVALSARVNEYRQGCAACAASDSDFARLSVTQLGAPLSVVTLKRGQPLPSAVSLGADGISPARLTLENDAKGDVEAAGVRFDPHEDALDFYESLEGMRVTLPTPRVVEPSRRFGEVLVLPLDSEPSVLNARGALLLESAERRAFPLWLVAGADDVNVGDGFTGPLSGVLTYANGGYRVLLDQEAALVRGGLKRESLVLGPALDHELTTATFNVHNLALTDSDAKFSALGQLIVEALAAPDILALQEVQDDSGSNDDGTVASSATLAALCSAIERASGPSYKFTTIAPEDGRDGGVPGGNIRVALLYRSDRGVALVQRGPASATTANALTVDEGQLALRYSPGRIEPAASAWENSRKSLVAQFTFRGQSFFVIANHFNSKLGDQPTFGRFQPPVRVTEEKRVAQAQVVAQFVEALLHADERARVVVLGDFNDVPESAPLRTLAEAQLSSVVQQLPPAERYTYIFEGNAQVLDHILVSSTLLAALTGVDIVHTNAEFSGAVSDHDPVLARFAFEP